MALGKSINNKNAVWALDTHTAFIVFTYITRLCKPLVVIQARYSKTYTVGYA